MLTITPEFAKQVESITLKALYERYPEGFVFDPIIITRETDYLTGEEYMEIRIVFDGDCKKLDPGWSLYRRIEPGLLEMGFDGLPSWSYFKKSKRNQAYGQPGNRPH